MSEYLVNALVMYAIAVTYGRALGFVANETVNRFYWKNK